MLVCLQKLFLRVYDEISFVFFGKRKKFFVQLHFHPSLFNPAQQTCKLTELFSFALFFISVFAKSKHRKIYKLSLRYSFTQLRFNKSVSG